MNGDGEETPVPRDVRLIHLMFMQLGIDSFQEHVPLQLMDFAHRYTHSVLTDAISYNEHRNSSSHSQTNPPLNLEDVRLAIAARTNYQFSPAPPKELLMEVASERNKRALPPVIPGWGTRLPPEKYCLTAREYDIDEELKEIESEGEK